ncbi:hypothetical protein ACFO1B_49670 [Dactylosporangium siamense]|uniref:Uncharacterized protein n=1 Tax=Dactylosporangium siamense TaxID=685454 RepID=A0A919PZB5_9ACTN|nr:hypothetical protein [Dactylosporangium siamense]GIG52026.1 hypothetical protein Dsi01nite_100670 [Dactylosporangium siamense]
MGDVAVRLLSSLTFWTGLLLGLPTGVAYQRMRSSWNTHRAAKALVPGLAKARWGFVRKFLVLAAVVAAGVLFSLSWIAGQNAGSNPVPASVPTLSPSPR